MKKPKTSSAFPAGGRPFRLWAVGLSLLLAMFAPAKSRAQQQDDRPISLEIHAGTLADALKRLSSLSDYKINYPSEDVAPYRVDITLHQVAPLDALKRLLEGKPFVYEVSGRFVTVRKTAAAKGSTGKFRTIEGRIVDEEGKPLAGANIRGTGSPYGAVSDIDGRFICKIPADNDMVEVSFIGMQTERISVAGRSQIIVALREDKQTMGDVVVTGYQKISRERSTAAFGHMNSEQLTERMTADLAASLEGQICGLHMKVNANTGQMAPLLRGIGTFSSNVGTMPLIVIDDIPSNMTLNDINPYNVESITVLKDAAASSIYGALAANGVIVVTTKSAKDEGAHVQVNADWFITSKPSFDGLRLASTGDIIDYQTALFDARAAETGGAADYLSSFRSGYYNPLFQLFLDRSTGAVSDDEARQTLARWRENDYYKEYRDHVWQHAVTQRYNLSLSQKAQRSSHFFSAGYDRSKGRTIGDLTQRISLYYKSDYAITKWLHLRAGIDLRMGKGENPETAFTRYDLQQRYERIMDPDGGRYTSPYVNVGGYSGGSYNGATVAAHAGTAPYKSFGFNVLDALEEGVTKTNDLSIRPFVSLQARILKMFKYHFLYQYEWDKSDSELYNAPDSYLMRMTHNSMVDENGKAHLPEGGRLYHNTIGSNRYTVRNQIDFDRNWADHSVTAIAGLEFRENRIPKPVRQLLYGYDPKTLTSEIMNWQSFLDGVGTSALSGTTIKLTSLPASMSEGWHRHASFYANASYSFRSRYIVSGSIRWDQADLFGLDIRHQRHPLWSVGGSWNLSEEKFMKKVKWIDYLKLRVTYGINGNVDQSSTTYFVVKQKNQSNPIKSTYLEYDDNDLPNPRLRWEKTGTFNAGLDFRLWGSRLTGSLEFYNRYASDLLVRRYMDPTLGASSHVVNNGQMRNRGIELALTADIIRKRDYHLSVDLSYAHNSNKMTKVDHSDADAASSFILAPQNYFIQGTSYNTLWAYRIDRIQNGYPIAVDRDGNDMVGFNEDGTVNKEQAPKTTLKGTDDLVNMGTMTPKYNGSATLRLGYKGLELNVLFIYAGGHKLRDNVVDMNDSAGSNTDALITGRWSADAPDATVRMYMDMPAADRTYASTFQMWWQYGDMQVKRADYLKLRSLGLSYSLPSAFCRRMHLSSLKIRAQVNNLFTWCAAGNGIDPESFGLNSGSRSLSLPKTYSIGLSLGF